jgi:hypothetical protein
MDRIRVAARSTALIAAIFPILFPAVLAARPPAAESTHGP